MFFSNNIASIDHCFFSRLGGNSSGIYSSLNCGIGSNDKQFNINKNLDFVARYFSLPKSNLVTMHQTHSNKSKIIKKNSVLKSVLCDGIVTKEKNLLLSVLTADCAPVLLVDDKSYVIGACHAGWRGAIGGIIQNTIKNMLKLGGNIKNIKCAIGPCINQKSYEVGKEFYAHFLSIDKNNSKFFLKNNKQILFSLSDYIWEVLNNTGILNIEKIDIDTYSETSLCFSHRKNSKNNLLDYGRLISTIVIKDT